MHCARVTTNSWAVKISSGWSDVRFVTIAVNFLGRRPLSQVSFQLSVVKGQLLTISCQMCEKYMLAVNNQLSSFSCQQSAVNSQLSTISCQLSAVNSQLSTISCQQSAVKYQLSKVSCQLSAVNYQRSTVSCPLSAVKCVKNINAKLYYSKGAFLIAQCTLQRTNCIEIYF